jgi:uncharacterized tellurite resistance protein B-like protein
MPTSVTPVTATRWVPPGGALEVHGVRLPDGMVYVRAPGAGGGAREPSAIDPALPMAERPSRDDEGAWFELRYEAMRPSLRVAYLHWLAGGRRHPRANIGHVLLFLAGLERRLLVDADDDAEAAGERDALVGEVRALQAAYGRNPLLGTQAERLLDALDIRFAPAPSLGPPPAHEEGAPLSVRLRLGLAQFSRDGRPVPGEWALAWLLAHPEGRLRTPARRCPDEFAELWMLRYRERYGDGMVLSPIKTRLDLDYRPVNPSLGPVVPLAPPDLPDVGPLLAPVGRLRVLGEEVAGELDTYSRWLGRHPEGRGTPAALALLPPALGAQRRAASATGLARFVEGALAGGDPAGVETRQLLAHWDASPRRGRLSSAEASLVAETLATRGFGLEPDPRFGAPPPDPAGTVVLFRLAGDREDEPSDGYVAAALLLQLAAVVAEAGGGVTEREERRLEAHLESALHLTAAERRRLQAHLRWVLGAGAGLAGARARIRRLERADRVAIGRFLVGVAGAGGPVDPREVATLTKLFRLLGLPAAAVYRQLHGLMAEAPVRDPARPPGIGGEAAAPGDGAPPVGPLALDRRRIERTLSETHAVSALLSGVFNEEDEGVPPTPPRPAPPAADGEADARPPLAGLDAAHSALVRALAARAEWERAEFDRLAAAQRLLPEGALDRVNEAAYDLCDAPLLDGDDPLEIDPDVLEELLDGD